MVVLYTYTSNHYNKYLYKHKNQLSDTAGGHGESKAKISKANVHISAVFVWCLRIVWCDNSYMHYFYTLKKYLLLF